MKQWKKVVAAVMAGILICTMHMNSAYAKTDVESMCEDVVEIMAETMTDEVTVSNGWVIMTTARAGVLTEQKAESYYKNLETLLTKQESSLLTEDDTANIVAILAVTAMGKDASNVAGYNLLEPLADLNYNTGYVTTGAMSLLAIDSNHYDIPKLETEGTQTTRENLIQYLLDQRNTSGTWGYSYDGTDFASVDTIAMVIQALAPYYDTNPEVKEAVDDGLDYMSEQQLEDGGYGSACSEAQAVIALTALDISPTEDERFVKNGYTFIDALQMKYVKGEGFTGWDGNIDLAFSTLQGAYGLVAYQRYLNGENCLYDMQDASLSMSAKGGHTMIWIPMVGVVGVIIIGGAVVLLIRKKKTEEKN